MAMPQMPLGLHHFLKLLKSKWCWIGVGSAGVTTAGAVCWSQAESLANESYLFTPDALETFKTSFDTQKIDKNSQDNIFGLHAGDCFRRFFSGADYSKPKVLGTEVKLAAAPNIDLSSVFMGCKLMKLSKTKDNKGFVYKSETTVKNDKYGFAVSMASTNLKVANRVDYGLWLSFLEKVGSNWTVIEVLGWESTFTPKNVPKFKTKAPIHGGKEEVWEVSQNPVLTSVDTFSSEYSDPSKWDHKLFSGLWIPTAEETKKKDLFGEGSTEKWGLRTKFGHTSDSQKIPNIVVNMKLPKIGEWKVVSDYCNSYKQSSPTYLAAKYRDLCYTKG